MIRKGRRKPNRGLDTAAPLLPLTALTGRDQPGPSRRRRCASASPRPDRRQVAEVREVTGSGRTAARPPAPLSARTWSTAPVRVSVTATWIDTKWPKSGRWPGAAGRQRSRRCRWPEPGRRNRCASESPRPDRRQVAEVREVAGSSRTAATPPAPLSARTGPAAPVRVRVTAPGSTPGGRSPGTGQERQDGGEAAGAVIGQDLVGGAGARHRHGARIDASWPKSGKWPGAAGRRRIRRRRDRPGPGRRRRCASASLRPDQRQVAEVREVAGSGRTAAKPPAP